MPQLEKDIDYNMLETFSFIENNARLRKYSRENYKKMNIRD